MSTTYDDNIEFLDGKRQVNPFGIEGVYLPDDILPYYIEVLEDINPEERDNLQLAFESVQRADTPVTIGWDHAENSFTFDVKKGVFGGIIYSKRSNDYTVHT